MPKLVAPLDAGSNKITNLGTPTASTDAATKAYVDANAGGGGSGSVSFSPSVVQYTSAILTQASWASSTSNYLNFPQGTTNTTDVVPLILQVATGNGLTVTTPTGYTLYTTLTDSTSARAFCIFVKNTTSGGSYEFTTVSMSNSGSSGNAYHLHASV